MPRYLVKRTCPDNLALPGPTQEVQARLTLIENNALDAVTWPHSYFDGKPESHLRTVGPNRGI